MNLSINKVKANRNFANKLWNASRLVISSIPKVPITPLHEPQWSLADLFIRARTAQVIRDVNRLFESYQYGEAGRQIYDFFWSDYADWYLEIGKLQIQAGGDEAFYTVKLMTQVLETILRLLHPYTPFVTEDLYGFLKETAQAHSKHLVPESGWAEALIVATWPLPEEPYGWERSSIQEFGLLQEIVRSIRNIRAERNIKPSHLIPATIIGGEYYQTILEELNSIIKLAKLDGSNTQIHQSAISPPENHIPLVVGPIEIYLPLEALVDLKEERIRLEKEIAEVNQQITRLEKLLASPFAEKAPEDVVQVERDRLAGFQKTAEKINKQLEALR
jgi:valyl-tRNA synthetase